MNQNPMTRRALLRTSALVVPALAGCAALDKVAAVAPQVAADAKLIADALATILPAVATVTGLGSNVVATATSVINEVRAVATQIAGATQTTAGGLVTQLSSGMANLATLLGGAKVPAWVTNILAAAGAIVPVIEQGVGIVTALVPHRMARTMAPEQARMVLARAVAR